ncbi:hypothetical protein CCP3SC15_1610010 [Gammaproteobacteria bacterium]
MLPDTETETRLLRANNYNCSYAFMDACKEIDELTARCQAAEARVAELEAALDKIYDIAIDYDGNRTVEALQCLIDEVSDIARKAAIRPVTKS